MENKSSNTVLLSINDISENEQYVIVKVTEAVGNKIEEKFEKGIKDIDGDIERFVPFEYEQNGFGA